MLGPGSAHTQRPPRAREGRRARRPRSRGHSLPQGSAGPTGIRARPAPSPGRDGSSDPPRCRPVLSRDSRVGTAQAGHPHACAQFRPSQEGRPDSAEALRAGGRGGVGVLGWVQMMGGGKGVRKPPEQGRGSKPGDGHAMQLDPGPAGHVTCVGRVSAQPHKLWAIKHLLCAPSHVWTQPGSRAAFLTPGAGLAQPSRHPGTPWRRSPSSPNSRLPNCPQRGLPHLSRLVTGSSPAGVPSVLGLRDRTTEETAARNTTHLLWSQLWSFPVALSR